LLPPSPRRLQPVAQRHQLIDLCNYALLLGREPPRSRQRQAR
jgi:hypothetical protein